MPRVTVAGPSFRRYDLLAAMCASCEAGIRKPDGYYFVDNGGGLVPEMAAGRIVLPPTAYVETPGEHVGVSAAWNRAIRKSGDYTIITNDDVTMHPHTIDMLVTAAETTDAEFITAAYNPGAIFCVFLIKMSAFERVGPFDEQFWPAYFEDNDYHRRMKLANVKELHLTEATYDHVGSATLKSFQGREVGDHHRRFDANRDYYVQKWGGLPGNEIHDTPQPAQRAPRT